MFFIQAKMAIKEEARSAFLADVTALMEATKQEAGCLRYELYELVQGQNEFLMVEEWQDQAALDQHNQAPLLQAFAAKMGEYCVARPTIKVLPFTE